MLLDGTVKAQVTAAGGFRAFQYYQPGAAGTGRKTPGAADGRQHQRHLCSGGIGIALVTFMVNYFYLA